MTCSLVDLSPELHLKITQELLGGANADEIQEAKEDDPNGFNQSTEDDKNDRKEQQSRKNRVHDLLNWSCASRFFRNFLTPYVFETINLTNTDKSGSNAAALSQSEHSRHVKQLVYVGNAPGDAHHGEEEYSNVDAILPGNVASVLSNLSRFISLETLSVEFPYHFVDYEEWDEGLDLCAEEESDDSVLSEEKEMAWRALMAKTWAALMHNEDTKIKVLDIRKLGPFKVSTFNDPGFHRFLGQFERFKLSIYGEDNGAGWKINKVELYCTMMAKLDKYLLNHLSSVKDLVLKAPEEGPLGLEGMSHVPLATDKDQMPALQTAYLEYILIGPELIDFLRGHKRTLQSLTLRKCTAEPEGLADNGISWNQFFDSLHRTSFEKLSHFELLHDRVPLTREECYNEKEDEANVPGEVKEARQVLKDDEHRRLFPYTTLDDKYGMIFEDEETNLEQFKRGEDQASYDRFMEMIRANAEKYGKK